MASFIAKLSRKKFIDLDAPSDLKRCLGLLDLTALGVGSTLGVGIYVLAGAISKYESGPGVALSFFVAAFASVFAGLCYAEFGARVPKAGSAYAYSYVCVGEFVAFVVGWSMLLSYGVGASSVAKGFSTYVNYLIGDNLMENAFLEWMPMNIPFFAKYVDLFAFGLIIILSIILSLGVKESTKLNNVLTSVNVILVLFVLIAGSINANTDNYNITDQEIRNNTEFSKACLCKFSRNSTKKTIEKCLNQTEEFNWCGDGGYLPYGFDGVMKGAATAFYGFVGFDVIATVGEEVINPQKIVPLSIVLSLTTVFFAYFGMSVVITLMLPYFLQNENAPIPFVFDYIGWHWAAWLIKIGAIMGLTASLIGAMIPLPRIVWAMASDGLMFKPLAYVHPRFQTPFISTLVAGLLFGILAAVFDLIELVDLMSIGTLLAYTMVSACVMLLRYTQTKEDVVLCKDEGLSMSEVPLLRQLFNLEKNVLPTQTSGKVANVATQIIGFVSILLCSTLAHFMEMIGAGNIPLIIFVFVLLFIIILCNIILARQPQSRKPLDFQVPLVPYIPTVSIFMNTYLMVSLSAGTWWKFAIYIAIGLSIYFSYGVWKSTVEETQEKSQTRELDQMEKKQEK